MKVLVIAGTTSGVGKTTVVTGLVQALVSRGLKVQPFKAGPDYIDPTYHAKAAGAPSRNLDTWLLSRDAVLELFTRAMKGMDLAVVEGVMGLYDSRSPITDEGSTAELARLLGAPTVLVVDAAGAARSVAAMVAGYKSFDPALNLAGVVLNNIGSEQHYAVCREAIEHAAGSRVFGYLPRRDELSLPERHLGLIPVAEGPAGADFYDRLASQVASTLDVEGLIALAGTARVPARRGRPRLFPQRKVPPLVRLGIARDRAFSFYYQDSLDLLEAWGAELVPFSPMAESRLPADVSGLYLGGGFPELYAAELSANRGLRTEIRDAATRGLPVYAECGGLMYLGRSIGDFEGRVHAMCGVFPFSSHMEHRRLTLGYRQLRALKDSPLMKRGEQVRGHEFHWSTLAPAKAAESNGSDAYQVLDPRPGREGFLKGNVLASYVHLHMGSLPGMAERFIEFCHSYRRKETP